MAGGGASLLTARAFLPAVELLAHRNRSDFCDLRLRCPSRAPEIARFPRQERAMMHCDLRLRWKVASDLRFRAAISEPKIPSFCGISGDLTPSTRKSLAIAIVRFWCAKVELLCLRSVEVLIRCTFPLQVEKAPILSKEAPPITKGAPKHN